MNKVKNIAIVVVAAVVVVAGYKIYQNKKIQAEQVAMEAMKQASSELTEADRPLIEGCVGKLLAKDQEIKEEAAKQSCECAVKEALAANSRDAITKMTDEEKESLIAPLVEKCSVANTEAKVAEPSASEAQSTTQQKEPASENKAAVQE